MKWSNSEIEILKNNYHKGANYVSSILGRSRVSTQSKMSRLNLYIDSENKLLIQKNNSMKKNYANYDYKVSNFTIEINEYSSYILGLLWTDGYILKNRKTTSISMVSDDLNELNWIFDKTGNWYKQYRKREKRRESLTLSAYNPNLLDSLINLNFDKKSYISPTKLFELIPDRYVKYLVRGIIDGDGCFYFNKKNYTYQLTIASTYEQDWSFYIDFFRERGFDFKVQKRVNKKSKSSIIRLCKRESIVNFCIWLYEDYENDKIGLQRKYNKSLFFIK